MEFKTHNTATIETSGSCLQGEINAKYDELCKLFGEPTDGDGYKVDAEWGLLFDDGTIATVYNWKDGKNYNGDDGLPTEQITEWHIGGFNRSAVDRVQIALDLYRESQPKNKIEEAFEDVDTMYKALASKHGEGYARTVEIAVLAKKLHDLNGILLSMLADAGEMEESKGETIFGVSGVIVSKIISKTSTNNNVKVTCPEDAQSIMNWADRIEEAENTGILSLMKAKVTKQ